jgi:Pvc16 N-terminal domain
MLSKNYLTMLMNALQFTTNVLDQYIKNKYYLDESKVILNNIIDNSGAIPTENQNKVVLSLINIEQETLQPFHVRNQNLGNGNYGDINPYQRFNLDLLLTSNFDNYNETLKFLNTVIQFFQTNVVLDGTRFSNIPQGLSKLEFEIERLNYNQMHSLWTAMGAKYQPSVVYKTRLLTIQSNENDGFISGINQTSNSAKVS